MTDATPAGNQRKHDVGTYPQEVPAMTQTPSDQILSESVLSLAQAAARLPGTRANNRIHPSTILRWILRGTRTPDGRLVRLEGCRCGFRWVTSAEALSRYVTALTPVTSSDPLPALRSPAQRRRDHDAADTASASAGY